MFLFSEASTAAQPTSTTRTQLDPPATTVPTPPQTQRSRQSRTLGLLNHESSSITTTPIQKTGRRQRMRNAGTAIHDSRATKPRQQTDRERADPWTSRSNNILIRMTSPGSLSEMEPYEMTPIISRVTSSISNDPKPTVLAKEDREMNIFLPITHTMEPVAAFSQVVEAPLYYSPSSRELIQVGPVELHQSQVLAMSHPDVTLITEISDEPMTYYIEGTTAVAVNWAVKCIELGTEEVELQIPNQSARTMSAAFDRGVLDDLATSHGLKILDARQALGRVDIHVLGLRRTLHSAITEFWNDLTQFDPVNAGEGVPFRMTAASRNSRPVAEMDENSRTRRGRAHSLSRLIEVERDRIAYLGEDEYACILQAARTLRDSDEGCVPDITEVPSSDAESRRFQVNARNIGALARACEAIQLNTIMVTVLLPPGLRESDDVMDRLDALVDLHDDIAIDQSYNATMECSLCVTGPFDEVRSVVATIYSLLTDTSNRRGATMLIAENEANRSTLYLPAADRDGKSAWKSEGVRVISSIGDYVT